LNNGQVLRRLPELHLRVYQSVFGAFELARAAYGSREGQKIEAVPLDERLQMPEAKFSLLWQEWTQSMVVHLPGAARPAPVRPIARLDTVCA